MNDFNFPSQPFSLLWLRRDLRLDDNAALQASLQQNIPIQVIFIFDVEILNGLAKDDARVTFIHDRLTSIHAELQTFGSALRVFHGHTIDVFNEIFRTNPPKHIFANEDFEPYARKRDQQVKSIAESNGCAFHLSLDHIIFHPSDVLKSDKTPYTVFTPYAKEWKRLYAKRMATNTSKKILPITSNSLVEIKDKIRIISLQDIGFHQSKIPFPPAQIATDIIEDYDKNRDFPAQNGTSKLGVHLRFGTISIRTLAEVAERNNAIYLNELIWREFYIMILFHFPHVRDTAFKADYRHIQWLNDAGDIERWKAGKTGYPLVDAGMRELVQTGYMHNRVRMVTASFLTKHLLVDWRIGESFFAQHLLDFELASNNGGWQWSAGTGTDAAPYFRIFNPTIQARTFDPSSKYIKQWVPEIDTLAYPNPIIDHTYARQRCLEVYKFGIKSKQ